MSRILVIPSMQPGRLAAWGLALMLSAGMPADALAGPFACQLDGEYRGHVGTRSHISTRQGIVIATFHPAGDCGEGTVHIFLQSRIFGDVTQILHDTIGTYTVDEDGRVFARLAEGVMFEGFATGYCGSIAHGVMFMSAPDPAIIFNGSMIRRAVECP